MEARSRIESASRQGTDRGGYPPLSGGMGQDEAGCLT